MYRINKRRSEVTEISSKLDKQEFIDYPPIVFEYTNSSTSYLRNAIIIRGSEGGLSVLRDSSDHPEKLKMEAGQGDWFS